MGRWLGVLLCAALLFSCTDNATRLRFAIEKAADRLDAGPDFNEEAVSYVPVADPKKGYWLIFFPERRVRTSDLVARGMPPAAAERIFRDLGYVDVGLGPMLVVYQEGERLTFTSYHGKKLVSVEDLIAEYRTGPSRVIVRKQNETLYITRVE